MSDDTSDCRQILGKELTQPMLPEPAGIEAVLAASPDPGFRARVMHEYGIIRRMTRHRVDLESARVLDFGCGQGIAAASFALRHPGATIFGLDIFPHVPERLRRILAEQTGAEIPENLSLLFSEPGSLPGEVCDLDLIYAWSVFEHVSFSQLAETMKLLKGRLRASGALCLQICPLYFSPKGSHLYRFDSTPWIHLIHEHDALKSIVMMSTWPEETKQREWKQFETLNRATADDICEAARAAGFSLAAQERLQTSETPPARLMSAYNPDALLTEEVRLLLV